VWPEFTGNSIFEAVESEGRFAFALRKGNERFVYTPAFSADGKVLITSLQRRKAQP
jgi:hypothetical protein